MPSGCISSRSLCFSTTSAISRLSTRLSFAVWFAEPCSSIVEMRPIQCLCRQTWWCSTLPCHGAAPAHVTCDHIVPHLTDLVLRHSAITWRCLLALLVRVGECISKLKVRMHVQRRWPEQHLLGSCERLLQLLPPSLQGLHLISQPCHLLLLSPPRLLQIAPNITWLARDSTRHSISLHFKYPCSH